MIIAIGCDHAGFPYKKSIINLLEKAGHTVLDFGVNSTESVDYADFVHPVGAAMDNKTADHGIVLCGSGNGVAMTVNKHQSVRCALVWKRELATLARQHNDANVLAIPVRFVSKKLALDMVHLFLETEFEGGRHSRRVDKIPCC